MWFVHCSLPLQDSVLQTAFDDVDVDVDGDFEVDL